MRCVSHQTKSWTVRLAAVLLFFITLAICAVPGNAQGLVEYEFAGVVTDNSGDLGVFGPLGTVQINDVITGRFSYLTGPSNPDQELGDAQIGAYSVVDFVLDQAIVDITPWAIVVSHIPGALTLPPLPPDPGTDGFRVVGSYMLGQELKSLSLTLEAPYQTVFTDDSLPTSLALEHFTDQQTVISIRALGIGPGGVSLIDAGQLTSLVQVPEPTSLGLLLLGLCARFVVRRSTDSG